MLSALRSRQPLAMSAAVLLALAAAAALAVSVPAKARPYPPDGDDGGEPSGGRATVQVSHLLDWGDGSDLESVDGTATVGGQSVSGTDATVEVASGTPVDVSFGGLANPGCFYLDHWAEMDPNLNQTDHEGSSGQIVADDVVDGGPDLAIAAIYVLDPKCSIA